MNIHDNTKQFLWNSNLYKYYKELRQFFHSFKFHTENWLEIKYNLKKIRFVIMAQLKYVSVVLKIDL